MMNEDFIIGFWEIPFHAQIQAFFDVPDIEQRSPDNRILHS